jgi:hypothetical protein
VTRLGFSPHGHYSRYDIFHIFPTGKGSRIKYPTGYNYTKYNL